MPDELVPNMNLRFPSCAKCKRRRIFRTAVDTITEEDELLPVCEEHFLESLDDFDPFDIDLEDILAPETSP